MVAITQGKMQTMLQRPALLAICFVKGHVSFFLMLLHKVVSLVGWQ